MQPPEKPWRLANDGMEQLSQLNAMERQQDTNLWSASAIYAATNGVLLLALMNAAKPILIVLLGIIGMVVVIVWDFTVRRAHAYEDRWIKKANRLQDEYGVPEAFAVWEREAPPGVRARYASVALRVTFAVVWSLVLVYGIVWLATAGPYGS